MKTTSLFCIVLLVTLFFSTICVKVIRKEKTDKKQKNTGNLIASSNDLFATKQSSSEPLHNLGDDLISDHHPDPEPEMVIGYKTDDVTGVQFSAGKDRGDSSFSSQFHG